MSGMQIAIPTALGGGPNRTSNATTVRAVEQVLETIARSAMAAHAAHAA